MINKWMKENWNKKNWDKENWNKENWDKETFWKIKNYGLHLYRSVRLFPKRLFYRAGTMEQYFYVKRRYETRGGGIRKRMP